MIHLTQDEKASRFDSLQAAFSFTKKNYERRMNDAENKYNRSGGDVIGAYNKGLADAYKDMTEDIEKWIV